MARGTFQHEELRAVPRGYRVRTTQSGEHELRIAYPPGRRKTGAGVLVSVLHPRGENPCKNPSSVFSYAVSLGYPYLRGEGKVADDGRTWLSRVTKNADGSGRALYIGYDTVKRKWIVEREENPANAGGVPKMTVSFDPAVKKFLAVMYDQKHGNLYATGYTKKQAAQALRDEWRRVRETGSWRNASGRTYEAAGKSFPSREKAEKYAKQIEKTSGIRIPVYETTGANPTKLEKQRAARERAARIRAARLNPHPREKTVPELLRDCDKLRKALRYRMGNPKRVTVSEGSGIDSGKQGMIIRWKGPRDQYSYKDESPRTSAWVRFDDGSERIMAKNRLVRSNPDELTAAEELYEKFHGRKPREILELQEDAERRGEYAALGDLVELVMISPTGDEVMIKFRKHDDVKLASSSDGAQLMFLGGNQDLSESLKMFGGDTSKDLIDLGDAKRIVYVASKWQTDFTPQEWKHDFGEESGIMPRGFYDQANPKKPRIFFAGGNYKVERPGIVD